LSNLKGVQTTIPLRLLPSAPELLAFKLSSDTPEIVAFTIDKMVRSTTASARCKLDLKPHANLPDTQVDLTSTSKYFQVLSDSARAF
jgi:hypothetical protein